MTINIAREKFDVVKQNKHLIDAHWNEIVKDKSGRSLDVHWEAFDACEQSGNLVTIIARENNEVIGYAIFLMQPHLHAKQTLCAHNDALFLKKEHRKGRAGIMLIKESKRILGELFGNVLIMWHVKPTVDFSKILIKLGYAEYETIYAMKVSA